MIELCNRFTCTGCSSCFNTCRKNAISMVEDAEGFLIPNINTNLCVECGACIASCPVLTRKRIAGDTQPIVFAGYINDENIRQKSSSGGMFTAIAAKFFEQDFKGKKYLVAAQFNEHLELNHMIVDSFEKISKMRCSKYVQSRIGDTYKRVKELLCNNSNVMFVGTPCQVAGLYSFLGSNHYDNLITVDLICHGTPSPRLFSKYLKKIGVKEDREYSDYKFRDTKYGYFTSSYFTKKGRCHKVLLKQHSYIIAYLKGWLHRECCYDCRFNGIPRCADITIGDFWGGISGKVPFYGKCDKGVSVIIGNTGKGEQMITDLSAICYLEPHTLEDAVIDNSNLIKADVRPAERDTVYAEMENMSPEGFLKMHNLQVPHYSTKLHIYLSRIYHKIFG